MFEAGTRIHKLGRNERPVCENCGREMWLEKIKTADFACMLLKAIAELCRTGNDKT